MNEETPPPLRSSPRRWGRKIGLAAAVTCALLILALVALVALRLAGLIGVYRNLTASMAPAINPGNGMFMEGVTYLFRKPARGEIIIFRSDGLSGTPPGEKYVKRLVGLSGDRLRISGGTLYVNDQPAPFRNKEGEVRYTTNVGRLFRREDDTFTVPDGSCFVLGDNSPNSADSRLWGAVPNRSVLGRVVFCYAPPADVGWIR